MSSCSNRTCLAVRRAPARASRTTWAFRPGFRALELTGRAYAQALKLGARVMVAKGATRLACDGRRYSVEIDDGPRIAARAVIIATGAEYRNPRSKTCSRFEGAGVYYGATPMEAQLCVGKDVAVVGAGNSAGQAAVFLASTARRRPHAGPRTWPGRHEVTLFDSTD